jgi:hypothetical protein
MVRVVTVIGGGGGAECLAAALLVGHALHWPTVTK